MRMNKTITVSLGKQQASIDNRLETGRYESASEVVRAALRALDREENALDEIIRAKVQEAIDDPRPSIPAEDVFAELRALHAEAGKAGKRGA